MKWLMKETFLLLKKIERGIYSGEPFDLDSKSFTDSERHHANQPQKSIDDESNVECK